MDFDVRKLSLFGNFVPLFLTIITVIILTLASATAEQKCFAPCWRIVPVGIYKNSDGMQNALAEAQKPVSISETASRLINRTGFWQSPYESRLVRLTGADLGFRGPGDVSRRQFYDVATDLGYNFCQAETAPALRINYFDQPAGEFLHIPVYSNVYDGTILEFAVGYDGANYLLFGNDGNLDSFIPAHAMKFVFCLN